MRSPSRAFLLGSRPILLPMSDVYASSLELHRRSGGKLSVTPKIPLESKADLSLAYTPGVAAVCEAIGKDKRLARELTIKKNTVAVVSDGSAILGLGNLGPEAAMPVMEGKAALFKRFADVDAFPICLDTQDPDEIVETVVRIAPAFGGINLEDISAPRCFDIERRLQERLDIPVMHDDQHGTATVVLAGLTNALRVKGASARDIRVVINGAGAAGTAIAELLRDAGYQDLTVCDSHGVVSRDRADLNEPKRDLAAWTNPRSLHGTLAEAIIDADVFIGVSVRDALTQDMVRSMRPNPIVFAMANPVPELMPDLAKAAGALVVATGRSDFPNQVNNVLAFPGIFRGALDHGVRCITSALLVEAARRLAACVPSPTADKILPDPFDPQVSAAVADAIR